MGCRSPYGCRGGVRLSYMNYGKGQTIGWSGILSGVSVQVQGCVCVWCVGVAWKSWGQRAQVQSLSLSHTLSGDQDTLQSPNGVWFDLAQQYLGGGV